MSLSRRRFLAGAGLAAGAVVTGGVVEGCDDAKTSTDPKTSTEPKTSTNAVKQPVLPDVTLPVALASLPARQHAWQATLATDEYGNATAPKFDRLLFFDIKGNPTPRHARVLEAALRQLEHRYHWGPDGLLFTVGWGHSYFTKLLGTTAPIPAAKALSDTENPSFDPYHLCLHLACDDERRLAEVETELLRGAGAITSAFEWRERRTGFTGAGLPAARQDVMGIPKGDPVPKTAPLYMGFKSGLKGNQATEDAVTIPDGDFAQGTTMAVSYMTLSLDSWYQGLDDAQRVGLMYSPQTTLAEQAKITNDAESNPDKLNQAINRYGVVGHSQSSARARRNGKAIILRRDFDTTDGGAAGLHFVSLQRDILDFVRTRTAMNANGASLQNPSVTETSNNGINAFIFVLKRANYVLPARAERALPLLPGRATALAA